MNRPILVFLVFPDRVEWKIMGNYISVRNELLVSPGMWAPDKTCNFAAKLYVILVFMTCKGQQ